MIPTLASAPVRFILVGICNTLVGLFFIFVFKALCHFSDALANALGYAIGLANSFLLNRSFTFKFKGATSGAIPRFALVALIGYFLNLWTVLTLIQVLHANSYVSQVLGVLPYTVFTYFGFKLFAFRKVEQPL